MLFRSGLKLEIALRSVPTPMLGLPIWNSTPKFVKEAIFRAAFALAGSKLGARRILGMNNRQFNNYLSKLDILTQYKEKKDGIN